jgi:restriction endonuclease S subunit
MITTINNKHNKLNFSNEREQSQTCLNSAEHEKNQGRKVLNVPNLRFPEFQGEWEKYTLEDVMNFSTTRVNSSELNEGNYVSTENMLQDYQGIVDAKSVPEDVNVISFSCGDILISNIRPYLKKVWKATYNGGCSSDVFVLKANDNIESDYLHYVIANDKFINFVMSGAKGVKMPRGDKKQMKTYCLSLPQIQEQKKISTLLRLIDERIATQNKIIDKLQSLIKGLIDSLYAQYGGKVLTSFAELGTSYSGLSGKSAQDFGSGKPFITYLNVYSNNVINENDFQYVAIKDGEKQNVAEYGDVLFTLSSETPEEVGIGSVYLGNKFNLSKIVYIMI